MKLASSEIRFTFSTDTFSRRSDLEQVISKALASQGLQAIRIDDNSVNHFFIVGSPVQSARVENDEVNPLLKALGGKTETISDSKTTRERLDALKKQVLADPRAKKIYLARAINR